MRPGVRLRAIDRDLAEAAAIIARTVEAIQAMEEPRRGRRAFRRSITGIYETLRSLARSADEAHNAVWDREMEWDANNGQLDGLLDNIDREYAPILPKGSTVEKRLSAMEPIRRRLIPNYDPDAKMDRSVVRCSSLPPLPAAARQAAGTKKRCP